MTIFDITRTLDSTLAVWPGDTPFQLKPVASIAGGDVVDVTKIITSSHVGTHIDAPSHFTLNAGTIESLDLSVYWGPAQVVTIPGDVIEDKALMPADIAHVDLSLAPRLLIHTPCSHIDPTQFPSGFYYPSPELASYLGEYGIILFGTDAPSVDQQHSKTLAGHHALQQQGILILEGLALSEVPDGLYELVALPLKIANGDGTPVRAALRASM